MTAVSGEAVFDRITETMQLIGELEPILQSLMMNDSMMIDALAQMLGSMQQLQQRHDTQIANLAADVRALSTALQRPAITMPAQPAKQVVADPEIELLVHLLPFLPNPLALDVGANTGHFAAALVEAGFEVFAFEPFAASFAALERQAASCDGKLHPFPVAIGAVDGTAQLLLATETADSGRYDTSLFHSTIRHPLMENVSFDASETVPLRSINSLLQDGAIPAGVAVLKIDTEGADLEVVKGAAAMNFAVVQMEFWDSAHPFGRAGHGDIVTAVDAMRALGFGWHIALYRVDETNELGFFCNLRSAAPKSWGNLVFFREFSLFSAAAAWCYRAFP